MDSSLRELQKHSISEARSNIQGLQSMRQIIIQAVAPIAIFGLFEQRSDNHVLTSVPLEMPVMIITAVSYSTISESA